MDRWMRRLGGLLGASLGAFVGVVAVQLVRLRRLEFLPGHPGFYINHVVSPPAGVTDLPALRLLVFGDSTTAGVGVSRPEESLPYLIAARVATARRRAVHVTSYGWAGARVADLAGDQLPRALGPLRAGEMEAVLPGADLIAVVVGSNDATHRTPPWRYRAHLRAALRVIRDAAPRAEVVLAGIPVFRGALRNVEPLIWLTDQYARLLRPISRAEAARVQAAYGDLARELPRRLRDRADAFSADRFHPSAAGYRAWANAIAGALLQGPGPEIASGTTHEPASA